LRSASASAAPIERPIRARGRDPERIRSTAGVALELTALIAEKEPEPARPLGDAWLMRYLQERGPTIDEIALVVGSLVRFPA
jgi:hypothetical protein